MEKKYNKRNLLKYKLSEQLEHGMAVSSLAYEISRKLGYSEEYCHDMAVAGMLHDVGKIHLVDENSIDDHSMVVEQMQVVRQHPEKSYQILKDRGYSEEICDAVLYHHENFDGTGYPSGKSGENIPFGARILRVCDTFCALISNRPYRSAFPPEIAIEMMIEENRQYDMKVFLAFQQVVHDNPDRSIRLPELKLDVRGELTKL